MMMTVLGTTSGSCVKGRWNTVNGVHYHVISAMFVNMRQPHVILEMRKHSPAVRPTSGRGSVRGGDPVLRYGKSLWGYTVINVCSEIDNSDGRAETGTW